MWALKTLTLDLVVEFETEESTATCDSLQRSPKDVVFQYPVRLMSPSLPWEVSEAVTNTVKSQLLGHCGCFVSYGRDIHSVLVLRTLQIVHSGLIGGHTGKWICLYDYDQCVVSVLQVFSEAKWSDLGWRQAQGIVSSLNLSCTCAMK